MGFPWYDVAMAVPGWDALWAALRPHLRALGYDALDQKLDRRPPAVQWADGALLLSQCCGLDVLHDARHLKPIAAPVVHGLGCDAGTYYSHVVARDEPGAAVSIAVNARYSRSGHTSLRRWLADAGRRVTSIRWTGSHAASIKAVRDGQADVAAIDAISWRVLADADLTIVGRTGPAPAPPFITASNEPGEPLREALRAAIADYGQSSPIGLVDIVAVDAETYVPLRADLELAVSPTR